MSSEGGFSLLLLWKNAGFSTRTVCILNTQSPSIRTSTISTTQRNQTTAQKSTQPTNGEGSPRNKKKRNKFEKIDILTDFVRGFVKNASYTSYTSYTPFVIRSFKYINFNFSRTSTVHKLCVFWMLLGKKWPFCSKIPRYFSRIFP